MLFALRLDIKDGFITRVAPSELYFPSVCREVSTYYIKATVDCTQLHREATQRLVSFTFFKCTSWKHPFQLGKNHLYLQQTYLLDFKCPGLFLCWRKGRDFACLGNSRGGQTNMFCSCLKNRERKKIYFHDQKRKGFNGYISKNIKQTMTVKLLYTDCFPPVFLFFSESLFFFFLQSIDENFRWIFSTQICMTSFNTISHFDQKVRDMFSSKKLVNSLATPFFSLSPPPIVGCS